MVSDGDEESESVTSKHPGVFVESSTPQRKTSEESPSSGDLTLNEETSPKTEASKAIVGTLEGNSSYKEEDEEPTDNDGVKEETLPPPAVPGGGGEEDEEELSSTESNSSESTLLNLRPKRAIPKKSKPPVPSAMRKKKALPKGKGRRWIFKKAPLKSPASVARAVTSDRVYYQGCYYTKGDIVSVTDVDGGIYYGQLRGFLTDQYCEKSGVISWLLPSVYSPKPEEGFDPATYVIGPEEDIPRKLSCFTFVMHAPDDYFHYKNAPYPTEKVESNQEYLVTRVGPKVRLIKDGEPFYRDSKIN